MLFAQEQFFFQIVVTSGDICFLSIFSRSADLASHLLWVKLLLYLRQREKRQEKSFTVWKVHWPKMNKLDRIRLSVLESDSLTPDPDPGDCQGFLWQQIFFKSKTVNKPSWTITKYIQAPETSSPTKNSWILAPFFLFWVTIFPDSQSGSAGPFALDPDPKHW